jgi:hypothetical protein
MAGILSLSEQNDHMLSAAVSDEDGLAPTSPAAHSAWRKLEPVTTVPCPALQSGAGQWPLGA